MWGRNGDARGLRKPWTLHVRARRYRRALSRRGGTAAASPSATGKGFPSRTLSTKAASSGSSGSARVTGTRSTWFPGAQRSPGGPCASGRRWTATSGVGASPSMAGSSSGTYLDLPRRLPARREVRRHVAADDEGRADVGRDARGGVAEHVDVVDHQVLHDRAARDPGRGGGAPPGLDAEGFVDESLDPGHDRVEPVDVPGAGQLLGLPDRLAGRHPPRTG